MRAEDSLLLRGDVAFRERLKHLRRIKPQIPAYPVARNDASGYKPMDGSLVATQHECHILSVRCPRWG
jgi:hypothetical protein